MPNNNQMPPNSNQNQQQQNQQNNRLQLNFNFNGGGQGNLSAEQGRAFPTTPSTFPQPLPNATGQQQEVWGTNQQPNSGFTQSGYFMNNPYTSQMQQQQNNLQASTPTYRSPATPQTAYNDGTNGLTQQFAHQNLGNQPRSQSPFARQPSPAAQRPRTAGQDQNAQMQYGQYLGSSSPRNENSLFDEEPPLRNPAKYSTQMTNRAKLQTELVGTFFKDSVERARDRNSRSVEAFFPSTSDRCQIVGY